MEQNTVLILGYGYVASFLKESLEKKGDKVFTTSRKGHPHILFDLNDPSTWDNIPKVKETYWLFPAEPIEHVQNFYTQMQSKLGNLVVVGSTRAFAVSIEGQIITESSAQIEGFSRLNGEQYLRAQGARLVFSAGIYGPNRSPLDWVRKKYVGISENFVNMIHVHDLCQFLTQSLYCGQSGDTYIASDNNPKTWAEAIRVWEHSGLLEGVEEKITDKMSKKIDSSQSIANLKINLKYPDFVDAVSKGLLCE